MEEYEIDYQFISQEQLEMIEEDEQQEFFSSFNYVEPLEKEEDKTCKLDKKCISCEIWKTNQRGCMFCEHYIEKNN